MRLTELAPRWFGVDGRRLGVTFLCPHCREVRLAVAFANPADGGEPIPVVTDTGMPHVIRELMFEAHEFEVPPGFLWTREGADFETLSLTPSVDASASGHWHGFVKNGEIV